ncbi:MAG: matrixin family metalloprotease [Myxococcales bacterium]|nr:matrixin family metalloprotease [Myxococcales bacterium]
MGIFALCLTSCRFESQAPQDRKREWQRSQAKSLAPAELSKGDNSWSIATALRVRIHVGPDYIRQRRDWQPAIEEQIKRVNEWLRRTLNVRLDIEGLEPWPREGSLGDMEAAIGALQKVDDGEGADLVIGYVGGEDATLVNFDNLGRAALLGKHMLIRAMDDESERRAIEAGLDALGTEERAELYRSRKRHKESVVFLHELGHALGALHARDKGFIMHPSYHHDMQDFAPENLELMRATIKARRESLDSKQLAASLREVLAGAHAAAWVTGDRERLEQQLSQLEAGGEAGASSAEAEPTTAEPTRPGTDLSALDEADRALFAELDGAVASGEQGKVFERIEALAERHSGVYAVQELLCRSAMQLGTTARRVRGYCKRMSELALELQ